MNNNRGMALVVALLTSFLLLALVGSLFWIIASTSRQAEYARNSASALNLAEAGTADAIYRLNYCADPAAGTYPFLGTYIPFDLASSDTFALSSLPELPPAPTGFSYADYGIKRNLGDGYYVVGVLQESDLTRGDTIISVGTCKGVRRTLSIRMRGKGDPSKTRNIEDQGISEAFNKHAVYCNMFTANGATVHGNIAYLDNFSSTFPTAGIWTRTRISTLDPPLPNRAYFESIGDEPPTAAIISIYTDPTGGSGPYPQLYDPDGVGPAPEVSVEAGPVFNFETGDVISIPVQVNGVAHFHNDSRIEAYTQVIGDVQIRDQSIVRNFLDATGYTIGIYGTPTIEAGANVCVKGTNVNFDLTSLGITINGGLIKATNNIVINHNAANTNPYLANFFAQGRITVDNSATNKCRFGDANTDVYLVGLGGITLRGADIKGTCYAQSGIWLGVNSNNVQPNGDNVPALIMDMWGLGSGALAISAPGTTQNIDGLIYAIGGGSSIVISSGIDGIINVNGALVADGTVLLSSGVLLNYADTVFTGTNSNIDIYSNFSGGRRAYVPAWQNWRLR